MDLHFVCWRTENIADEDEPHPLRTRVGKKKSDDVAAWIICGAVRSFMVMDGDNDYTPDS